MVTVNDETLSLESEQPDNHTFWKFSFIYMMCFALKQAYWMSFY